MRVLVLFVLLFLPATGLLADDDIPTEIDYLLRSIGRSECTFIRNGKHYDSRSAEDHLRMKYRRGKRYATTSEEFIKRLASNSSMSKKVYYIQCVDGEKTLSGDWLLERLGEYRRRLITGSSSKCQAKLEG